MILGPQGSTTKAHSEKWQLHQARRMAQELELVHRPTEQVLSTLSGDAGLDWTRVEPETGANLSDFK